MTNADTTNAYLQSKVFSARPEELRLLLLDGSLKFAHQAKHGLESKNPELSYEGFTQCRAIVLELMTTINAEAAGEVGEQVKGLLSFMYTELIDASREKDIARLDKVIELLEYERETWLMVMERLASEQGMPGPSAATQARAQASAGEPTAPGPNQGRAGGFSLSA
ncbi:MAG: flagellar export chaperone FliS [Planctomycetota bacterium]